MFLSFCFLLARPFLFRFYLSIFISGWRRYWWRSDPKSPKVQSVRGHRAVCAPCDPGPLRGQHLLSSRVISTCDEDSANASAVVPDRRSFSAFSLRFLTLQHVAICYSRLNRKWMRVRGPDSECWFSGPDRHSGWALKQYGFPFPYTNY